MRAAARDCFVSRVRDRERPRTPSSSIPSVEARLDATVGEYWRARLAQTEHDSYHGVPLLKMPEDLRTYEHLLWSERVNCIIEIGGLAGGSALWFRDRLRALAAMSRIGPPCVVSIDADTSIARDRLASTDPRYAETIKLVEGDVLDPGLPGRVAQLIPPGSRCLAIEDTAHTYETTTAALRGFSGFIHIGGFFVVEDGVVDVEELRIADDWPRGVRRAVDEWLAAPNGSRFQRRADLERYGLSCHVGGYLQRVS